MARQTLAPAELIAALSGHDTERRQTALHQLFGDALLRQAALVHVRKHGGNQQDGEDVFQEAIIVFDRKLRQGAYHSEGSLEAYFMGIVRWHWHNEQHRAGHKATLLLGDNSPEPPPDGDPEMEYLLTERREMLDQVLDQLADKCRNLLKMYRLEYSMEEVAHAMHYANSGVAKKEAFLCRKRFQALLKMRPEIWRDLIRKEKL